MIRNWTYFLVLSGLLIFTACEENEQSKKKVEKTENKKEETENERKPLPQQKEPNVVIAGEIDGGFNTPLVLEANTPRGAILITEGFSDKQGAFTLKGNIEDMGLYQLRIKEKREKGKEPKVVPMTLVPDDSVFVQLNFDSFSTNPVYSNTTWAPVLNEYMEEMKKFVEWQKSIKDPQKYDNEKLMEMVKKERKSMDDFTKKTINKDPSNPANILLMTNLMPMMGYDHWDKKHLEVLKKLQSAYQEAYPNHPMTEKIINQVSQVEKDYNEYINFTEKNIAPEIALKDPQGKTRRLSDLRGKYVLVDFWASWCGPCRVENPNVVKVYHRFKDKGFDIFSVSLDKNRQSWTKAIKADGLKWKNHVSDLKMWESDVVPLYNIRGIPHTVLLDPEGKIVGNNLRGDKLEQKLEELLN